MTKDLNQKPISQMRLLRKGGYGGQRCFRDPLVCDGSDAHRLTSVYAVILSSLPRHLMEEGRNRETLVAVAGICG